MSAQFWNVVMKATDHAEIMIYDVIGESLFEESVSAKALVGKLRGDLKDVKSIDLRLNTPGGSVPDGLAIYNTLKQHPAAVTSYIDGFAASIATVIMLASDEIIMGEGTEVMIHEPRNIAIGTAKDMSRMARDLEGMTASMVEMYMKRTGRTEEEIRHTMQEEIWYVGQEAVDFGLADRVESNDNKEVIFPTSREAVALYGAYKSVPGKLVVALAEEFGRVERRQTTKAEHKESKMELEELRKMLGLPEGSTEDQIREAARARLQNPNPTEGSGEGTGGNEGGSGEGEGGSGDGTTPNNPGEGAQPGVTEQPATATPTPGTVTVDAAAFAQLQANAQQGAEARAHQVKSFRDGVIATAMAKGKFGEDRKKFWREELDKNPEAIARAIENMPEGVVPVGQTSQPGGPKAMSNDADSAYDSAWLSPAERARIAAAKATN